MAAVEITISGVLYDKYNRTQQNVVLIGEASITGLGVGGGPIIPPGGGGGGNPPGIWGPTDPRPTPPIYWPGFPGGGGGGSPPGFWGGGNVPMPNPPIANVPGAPGYQPPDKPPEPVQPPVEWKAIWAGPEQGWVVVGIPQGPHPAPST